MNKNVSISDFEKLGFRHKHKLKDATKKSKDYSQHYQYIFMKCPCCNKKSKFLCPAINQCLKCKEVVVFCAVNNKNITLNLWSAKKLIEMAKKSDATSQTIKEGK